MVDTLIGVALGVLATLFVVPLFADDAVRVLVRIFGSHLQKKQRIGGAWRAQWTIDGRVEKRDRGLDHIIEVKQLGDRVTGGFSWRGRTYRLDGKITGDRYVTGTWRDDVEGVTHHGAFQLIIGPHARTMKGRWLGFSFARNVVNAGDWEWRRVEPSLSSVEAGGAQPQEVDLPSAPGTSSQG